ncbi:MAG: (2Fe-2S) ferredoxin domain-containing protein [Chloroflexota bacterium]|nr:(2Fe-2S) ferredoxin domain-containing protein [Chloroflexota bacterium]
MTTSPTAYLVHLCFGSNCTLAGSRKLLHVLEEEIVALGIADQVTVVPTTCRNRCDWAPSMNVLPGNIHYNDLDADAIRRIAREHLAAGVIVDTYVFRPPPPPTPTHGRRVFTFDPNAFRPEDE